MKVRDSENTQSNRHVESNDGALSMAPPPFQLFSSSALPPDGDARGNAEGLEIDERGSNMGKEALNSIEEGDTRQVPPATSVGGGGGSCSASATGVSLGASTDFNDGTRYGLITPINIQGTELADVLDSELVGASVNHTGSMTQRPSARSSNSGFMAADNIPDDRHMSGIADHLSYYDNHGGDGSYDRLQMDLFKIPKCGINTPQAMPNSGYRLKRHIFREGQNIVGQITKTAEAVTVDGHSASAGLTPQRQTAKLVLRTLP